MKDAPLRFETQEENEKIIFFLRAHPITNLRWLFAVGFLALFGLGLYLGAFFVADNPTFPFAPDPIKGLLLLLVWWLLLTGFALERFLHWYFNIHLITNKSIVDIDFLHLFVKQISETSVLNVQDVTHRTVGLAQNHFDYGDVFIQTAGEQPNFEFHGVPDPDGVQRKIIDISIQARKELEGGGNGPN